MVSGSTANTSVPRWISGSLGSVGILDLDLVSWTLVLRFMVSRVCWQLHTSPFPHANGLVLFVRPSPAVCHYRNVSQQCVVTARKSSLLASDPSRRRGGHRPRGPPTG